VPRDAFLRGAIVAMMVALPATAGAAMFLSSIDVGGDPLAPFERVLAFAAVFAGVPALISIGGVGRLAARASAFAPRRRTAAAISAALPACGAIGAGLTILTLVPLGAVPASTEDWALAAGAGVVAGFVPGAILGLWIGTSRDPA
jgi:hypothetical protein